MRSWPDTVPFETLLGKTIIELAGLEADSEYVYIKCSDNMVYVMYHYQDCCESVTVEDVCGDVNVLLGTPITLAEVTTEEGEDDDYGTHTWTFYKLATAKGYVTIRWYGESNGYYSESVDFVEVGKEAPRLKYIRGLISGLYTIEGCAAGGLLHIVTDDGNLRDSDIKFCLEQCEEHPEKPEAKLGKLICTELLKLTEEERELI